MSTMGNSDLQQRIQGLITSRMSPRESCQALQSLSTILQQSQPSWPTLDLIISHSKLSRALREDSSSGDTNQSGALVADIAQRIKQTYGSLADFISQKPDAALRSTDVQKFISHAYLRSFVSRFALPIEQQGERKPVVSIALPNGPLLAATCMAVSAHYIAAPINPAAGPQQFEADALLAGVRCILTTREDYAKLQLDAPWTRENNILILLVDQNDDMNINISMLDGAPLSCESTAEPNAPDDIALVLFTSGTSGKKKVVPITTHSIVAGVAFVIDSWAMTNTDVCLNMMPLYHM